MRILLSAFIGSDNLGDEAIASVLIKRLASEAKLTVLTKDSNRTKKLVPGSSFKTVETNFFTFFKTLRASDCLVLGGGGIINDESSIISLAKYYFQVFMASKLFKKPVYLLFVGVGPIKTKSGSLLLSSMGKMISYALVRDEESAKLLKKHGFAPNHIITAYDIAFNFPAKNPTLKAVPSQPFLLFCPRDWFFLKKIIPTKQALKFAKHSPNSQLYEFRNNLLKLTEATIKQHPSLTIVAVPFYFSQDLDLLLWIRDRLPKELAKRYVVQEQELSPGEFLSLAERASVVVGVRLHSLILGALAKTPLIALTYSDKVKNLTHYLGLTRFTVMLEKPGFDTRKTINSINQVVGGGTVQKISLKEIQKANEAAFKKIIAIILKTP